MILDDFPKSTKSPRDRDVRKKFGFMGHILAVVWAPGVRLGRRPSSDARPGAMRSAGTQGPRASSILLSSGGGATDAARCGWSRELADAERMASIRADGATSREPTQCHGEPQQTPTQP
eukprot:5874075-Pyramimonas_sp.AAC.1